MDDQEYEHISDEMLDGLRRLGKTINDIADKEAKMAEKSYPIPYRAAALATLKKSCIDLSEKLLHELEALHAEYNEPGEEG